MLGEILRHSLFNLQSSRRAFQVGEQHYDIGNDVFEAMLDPTMSYSCAYWHNAAGLRDAQLKKLDMICRKLELKPGERMLEIGCGWGGLARYAAEHYGVEVVGITISKEQQKLARARCEGLPVSIELMDYRDLTEQYDKIVSVGMFEHVGPKTTPSISTRRIVRSRTTDCSCCTPSAIPSRRRRPMPGSTNTSFPMASCRRPKRSHQPWKAAS